MDRARIDGFLDRFVELASGATTIGLLAVADRSGLSRHLGDAGGGTAEELADGAGLDARYVEEIMSGLTAAGIVEYDPETKRFDFPPEHALFLSAESSPYFMGGFFDLIPAFLAQIDGVAKATREGGGVGFEEFGEAAVRGIARAQTASQSTFLVSRWLPAVPGLVHRLESGIRLADVGCGSGTAAILMAEAFPRSQIAGFDVSALSIETARTRAAGLANIEFHEMGVEDVPTDPPFDLITTFDVIHDLADPLAGMQRIHAALADDGVYLMMEPNASSNLEENLTPRGAMLYGTSTLHCMTQSLAQGGSGLGAAWGRARAESMAGEAGFGSFQPLEDITNKFSAFYLLTR
ncbi:MAG TPA: class I SAM-dependent methyltransferase [Acidimicrobiia bacterium]|nr:class I SAM-dependent methyltransferase [Acidimicrobiia bacterium]